MALGFVRYTRGLGRKRIVISNNDDNDDCGYDASSTPIRTTTTLKRQRSERLVLIESDKSTLESLPQDILIRILCGVDHDDLKQLFHVSKSIREATLIAKQWHFAYSTPTKTRVFRTSIDFEESNEFDEIEAPNAPKQQRRAYCYKSRINEKNLTDISVALFSSPKKELFMDIEI